VNTQEAKGLKLRLFGWNFRLWKYGFEYGNKFGGSVVFFPWSPIFKQRK
jgi:hypothetical protein